MLVAAGAYESGYELLGNHTRCLYCFKTVVASAVDFYEELELAEGRHLCFEWVLSELVAQTPFPCHGLRPQ